MNSVVRKLDNKLEEGFYGFWVKKYRVSFLLIFLIIFSGLFSMFTIPKESSPDIKFGIIGITTIYPGVNPNDIDSLITEKIENEIDDIEGIKKITSTSTVGVSSITVELNNNVDVRNALTDIKDEVDKIVLPEDAEDPNVIQISTSSDLMFEVLLYGDEEKFSKFDLKQKSQFIKDNLEGKIYGLSSIDLYGADLNFGGGSSSSDYRINVLLDKNKIEQLDLSLVQISSIIKSYNKNTPIGNFSIGELDYDFRIDGELASVEELKNIVIKSTRGSNILLGDIAEISKEYNDNSIKKLGFNGESGYNYTSLSFNKIEGTNVFDIAGEAKVMLEELIENNIELKGLNIFYTKDMSELIIEDYANLGNTAIQTLLLVFITILIFVGYKESIIASMLIPLAFFITFIVLDTLGYSLNFLTNFSLVLTLGIAIDTVIVIIEGASEKLKLGYNRKSAILLAVKDFKAPLIAGTLTTLVAFLPLMFLPGVMGKFLAYIPITVFSTLVAALFLSLTISSALFVKFVRDGKTYHRDERLEETFSEKQKIYLDTQREGKTEVKGEKSSMRNNFLSKMGNLYFNSLKYVVVSRFRRISVIIIPVVLLIFSFLFISPKIGFILFPETDNGVINISIEGKKGANEESFEKYIPHINDSIRDLEELKVFYVTVSGNNIDVYIELLNKNERKDLGLKNVFEVEEIIANRLSVLESDGLNVSIKSLSNGPPTGKALGVKLIATTSSKVDELKQVAEDFKEHFKTIEGLKNVSTTSSDSPGQFIFEFNKSKLSNIGLTPDDVIGELYFYTNGLKAGSIKSKYEDNDIYLKISQFDEELSPDNISDLMINTKVGKIRLGDFIDYRFDKAVSSINRENSKISITVESDVESGKLPTELQPKLLEYAENYVYPEGIYFEVGGENQENADLIQSTIKSMFITLFLIFSILVFQFNSYKQPAMVLYSVILAFLGVNFGLYITGNPYSMPFMIGFIALMGIVVNDAIILIDRINRNLEKGIEDLYSVLAAGKSRLQPIIVTTLTTVFGVLPLALQDEFWAGLGFTIIFGLFAGSAMTLFVIPSLYYQVFLRKKEKLKTK